MNWQCDWHSLGNSLGVCCLHKIWYLWTDRTRFMG